MSEPIEINAGGWYLRALREDERVNDTPALADAGITDPDYVNRRAEQWANDTLYSWAVCQPNTGELLAEVDLELHDDESATMSSWARTGHDEAMTTGADAVRRFAEGALGLTIRSS